MTIGKIKMPICMQGCHRLKVLFEAEAHNSTVYPTHIRMAEYYIYYNKIDEEAIKKIVQEIKERYHERN